MMRSSLRFFAFLGLVLLGGCSHYQLGTTGKPGFHSLYIEPVENNSQLPQATAIISTQLREAFLRDGRVTLVSSPSDADAVLSVTLAQYGRETLTARPDDTGLARKFDLALTAACTLRDNRTGRKLFEKRPVEARQQIFATGSPEQAASQQLQAEYQAVPLLAHTLADKVAHAALDVW